MMTIRHRNKLLKGRERGREDHINLPPQGYEERYIQPSVQ